MASIGLIDIAKEQGGVWCENPRGYAVKVRPMDCERVQARIAKDVAKSLGASGKKQLADEDFAAILRTVVAEEVLVDWRDIDGAPTYSVEKAREFMHDPRARQFQNFVTASARDTAQFEEAGVQTILGN